MHLTTWNPFREMDDLLTRFQRGLRSSGGIGDTQLLQWAPAVDIAENPAEYLVKAELPGVHREDVHITVHNGVLTNYGERRAEAEEKSEMLHRVERAYGSFTRSFALPGVTCRGTSRPTKSRRRARTVCSPSTFPSPKQPNLAPFSLWISKAR